MCITGTVVDSPDASESYTLKPLLIKSTAMTEWVQWVSDTECKIYPDSRFSHRNVFIRDQCPTFTIVNENRMP